MHLFGAAAKSAQSHRVLVTFGKDSQCFRTRVTLVTGMRAQPRLEVAVLAREAIADVEVVAATLASRSLHADPYGLSNDHGILPSRRGRSGRRLRR